MRNLFLIIFVIIFQNFATSQNLKNTKWCAYNIELDSFSFKFLEDSIEASVDFISVVLSWYKTNKDTIWIIDNPDEGCMDGVLGSYIYKVEDKKLYFKLIDDVCEERRTILDSLIMYLKEPSKTINFDSKQTFFYPNPNSTGVFFTNKDVDIYSFEIYNQFGQNQTIKREVNGIDISLLPKGIYFCKHKLSSIREILIYR